MHRHSNRLHVAEAEISRHSYAPQSARNLEFEVPLYSLKMCVNSLSAKSFRFIFQVTTIRKDEYEELERGLTKEEAKNLVLSAKPSNQKVFLAIGATIETPFC